MVFNSQAQKDNHLTGKVSAPQTHTLGEPALTPTNTPVLGQPTVKSFEHLQGDVAYIPNDTTKKQPKPTIKGNVKCTNPPPKKAKPNNRPVMGMLAFPPPPPKKEEKK